MPLLGANIACVPFSAGKHGHCWRNMVSALTQVMERRKLQVEPFMAYLDSLAGVVQTVALEACSSFEAIARQRLARRDENDWPILATALSLRCPIWTEDADFFGCGVATWTTDRVELYLAEIAS